MTKKFAVLFFLLVSPSAWSFFSSPLEGAWELSETTMTGITYTMTFTFHGEQLIVAMDCISKEKKAHAQIIVPVEYEPNAFITLASAENRNEQSGCSIARAAGRTEYFIRDDALTMYDGESDRQATFVRKH